MPTPTCIHCGVQARVNLEAVHTARSGGVMRITYDPCKCMAATAERAEAARRKRVHIGSALILLAGSLVTCIAAWFTAQPLNVNISAAAVGLSLLYLALAVRLSAPRQLIEHEPRLMAPHRRRVRLR